MHGPRQGNFDVTDEDTVEFVHENLKIALPESRVSGGIACHMSVSAHWEHDDIRYGRGYKKLWSSFKFCLD